ncbi:membrane hypothetical protein [Hyella patelloides LEGE 07179]|uniref:Uncharacterized protein n=1 Tax=Hyella patelloides LEGE 07179 TaxID=945734 RepID=A0A563W128_9CYAN|nr:hypothetical protein [Hyella patelloides]VEP17388.1 membrane hypothetical protein [Hyella patelloides LEGE 07179]
MEDTNQNKPSNKVILEPERARALIITLALGIVICTGLIIYSLITHNAAFNFLDSSLFKPRLLWLGFVGMILFFESYLFFMISITIFESLPEKEDTGKITAIIGILLLSVIFFVLFFSYDLENEWRHYVGLIVTMTGAIMTLFKQIIQHKFPKIAKIWSWTGAISVFTGLLLLAFSFDS